jgi:hypothetical protein
MIGFSEGKGSMPAGTVNVNDGREIIWCDWLRAVVGV